MAGFSTNGEIIINKSIIIDNHRTFSSSPDDLQYKYNLNHCLQWIKMHAFSKICLQFPDSLLVDSTAVSIWLENCIGSKVYLLGDTSYGSCCVDEVAAEHINADAIIHFGHACLSPVTRLPVLYVFPKLPLCVATFILTFKKFCQEHNGQVLLLYDVEYEYCLDTIRTELISLRDRVIISELCVTDKHNHNCSQHCQLNEDHNQHQITKLGRAFCIGDTLANCVFISSKDSKTLKNFAISLNGINIYSYNEDSLEQVCGAKMMGRLLYLSERVKDAKTVGILIGTLSIKHYLAAAKRIRNLCARRRKKCYTISVGKPTVAKLANFPEVEIFVMVSCPEALLEDEKEYLQPVVTLMEVELALNEARQWGQTLSTDFMELLPGGKNYVSVPDMLINNEPDVSLLTNQIRNADCDDDSSNDNNLDSLVVRSDLPVAIIQSSLVNRSWQGLEQSLGQTPVTKATLGRSGIPLAYNDESHHSKSTDIS